MPEQRLNPSIDSVGVAFLFLFFDARTWENMGGKT